METLSVINLMPSTKGEIDVFVEKTVSEVSSGTVNPLELFSKLKAIEIAVSEIKSAIEANAMDEFSKYGSKNIEYRGFKIEQSELGVKYDFANCGDSIWNDFKQKQEIISNEIKERESVLKIGVKGEDGKYIIYPANKSSKTGLKFTLKK